VYRTSDNHLVSHRSEQKDINVSQFGTDLREDDLHLSHHDQIHEGFETGGSLSAGSATDNTHESDVPHISNISHVSRKQDLQEASVNRPLEVQITPQQADGMLGTTLVLVEDSIYSPQRGDVGACDDRTCCEDTPPQTHSQYDSDESTYTKADHGTLSYLSPHYWDSRSSLEDLVTETHGQGEPDDDSLSWDIYPAQEGTAWNNDLAGVGGHFPDDQCSHGYARLDDFNID
jgi:hypothetical protein